MPKINCPIKVHSILVLGTVKELNRVTKRMAVAMKNCHDCPDIDDCLFITEFRAQLTTALHEIYKEWGLE